MMVHGKNLKLVETSSLVVLAHFWGYHNPYLMAYFYYLHFCSLITRVLM